VILRRTYERKGGGVNERASRKIVEKDYESSIK
jgi:hypothetical protein